MGLVLTDRVKETSITSGTGSITLTGAFGGFISFLAGIGNGNTTYYVIENGSNFEVGIGTYTEVGNTLSRDTVLSSSNGGAKVDLSGVSFVFCTYPASKSVHLDANGRLSAADTNFSLSGIHSSDLSVVGDAGISGLLTLRRTTAGNFFHAYVDDSNDKTISLYHDATVAPDWKLGLKDSPSNSGDPPTYAYLYAGDGSIGLYSNSLNSINLNHGGGFNIVNKGDTVFSAYSTTGIAMNSFAAGYPVVTVKGAAAQSASLQQWTNSSDAVLAKVESDGDFSANSITATGNLLVDNTNVISNIRDNSTSGVAISGWAKYYTDNQDHSATAVSGALQPQITKNTSDILLVSGLTAVGIDALTHASGDYFLDEIRSNSASGTTNASDLLVVSGIAASVGSALPVASGGKITYNLNEIRANSASGNTNATNITANTNLVNASGDSLLSKITVNSNSGITRNTNITANEARINASGNSLLTKITVNSVSGSTRDTNINNNTLSINSSGNMLLDEVRANSASGLVISGIAAAGGGGSLPYSSGDFFLSEIGRDSASGVVISGIANANTNLINASGAAVSGLASVATAAVSGYAQGYADVKAAANASNITANTNLINASGAAVSGLASVATAAVSGYAQGYADVQVALLIDSAPAALDTLNELAAAINDDANISTTLTSLITANTTEVRANSASGNFNLTEIRANSASGNANLTEIRANSASGVVISGIANSSLNAINNSGVFWLGEIQTNSASGAANLTEIRANSASGTANLTEIRANSASGNFNLTEIRANSASGAANLTEIRANSASGTVNVNAINASGDFLLNEITTNSASGNFSAGSGIELHGKAFQAAVSGANLLATNTPTDNYVPSYDIATGKFTWVENAGGGGGGGSMTSVKSNGSAVGGSDIVTLDFSSDFGVAETPDTEINITIGTLNQSTTGSAATLTTARAIALAGDVTGTANFDGSAGISITTTLATDAIVTANITDLNVTTGKIAADAITGAKIADDAIDSEHYADGSIDTAHIADDQVTYAKVQDVAATSRVLGRITAGAGVVEELTGANIVTMIGTLNQNTTGSAATLTTARAIAVAGDVTGTANFDGSAGISITTTLATDAIVTANITDLNVTTAKIAADAITGAKIADDAIDSEHYAAGSIDTAHIADDQITLAKMAGITRGSIIIGNATGDPTALAIGSDTYVLTSNGTDIAWAAAAGGGDITGVTLAGDSGTAEDLTANVNLTIAGGNGITTAGSTATLTVALDAALTTVTSMYNASLKMGRDSQNLIDFATTDNKIILRVNNVDEVELVENALSPVTSDGVALGTTSLQWSDLFLAEGGVINWDNGDVTLTQTGNSLALAGGNFVIPDGGTIGSASDTDAITISSAGAVTFANSINQAHEAVSLSSNTATFNCALSNYFEVAVNAQVNSILFTNATAGQRIVILATESGGAANMSEANGWDTITINTNSGGDVEWAGGTEPTLAANTKDMYGIIFSSNVLNAYGFIIGQDLKD